MVLFDEEVCVLEQKIGTYPAGGTVFYGSSSVRLWTTLEADFPDSQPVNIGFGGATLAACAWHFERLVVPARPRALVLYAGDNDLGEGRQSEEVCLFFCALAEKIRRYLPNVRVTFLSIKPSPARWHLVDEIRLANTLIGKAIADYPQFQFVDVSATMLTSNGQPDYNLYQADSLHLNENGYDCWRQQLTQESDALRIVTQLEA